jgi:hypothetical protein
MKPLHPVFAAIALCVLSAWVCAQNSSLEGIVYRSGSADALSKAQVELRSGAGPNQVIDSLTTESDGRFRFQNVRPGRYRLNVQRRGYFRSPLIITVAAGQSVSSVQLSMTPAGAISGRIYDANGEPLGNADVQALRASYPQGHRTLTFVQSAITNDLGEFRLFDLPPGRYYIAALHPQFQGGMFRSFRDFGGMFVFNGNALMTHVVTDPALGPPVPKEEKDPQAARFVPIYYPGTPEELNASAIDLRPGTDFGGVNIAVSPVRPRHVRGVIADAAGEILQDGSVTAAGGAFDALPGGGISAAIVNGAFDLTLNPGRYLLIANAPNGKGYAMARVENADIDGVTIRTASSFNVLGRITVESKTGSKRDLSQMRISLQPNYGVDGRLAQIFSYSTPLANGSLTLAANSGDYRVNLAQLPPDTFVKSIRLGNVDVLSAGFHLEGPPSGILEIVLSTDYGVIDGNVSRESTFVLVPNVRNRTDLYRAAATDSSGHFHVDQIPPGDYKMFAWSDVEEDAWFDPDFIRNFENEGRPIRVAEGNAEQVQLKAIAY